MSRPYDERTTPLFTATDGSQGLLSTLYRVLVRPVATAFESRRAYLELMALDDRQLADIGLRRGEIEAALTGNLVRPQSTPVVARRESAPADLRRAA